MPDDGGPRGVCRRWWAELEVEVDDFDDRDDLEVEDGVGSLIVIRLEDWT